MPYDTIPRRTASAAWLCSKSDGLENATARTTLTVPPTNPLMNVVACDEMPSTMAVK